MISTTEITKSMEEKIDQIRLQENHLSSSHAFESIYIWQTDMKLSIYLEEDMFAVKYGLRGANSWFFPCGSKKAVHDFLSRLLQDESVQLNYLRKEDVEYLQAEFPDCFEIKEMPADSEYLFNSHDLINLYGKDYAALRKFIHRLEREHEISCLPLDKHNIQKGLGICNHWHSDIPHELHDHSASQLLLAEQLFSIGLLILVDQIPCAVAAGYPLSSHIFDISLAKQIDGYSDLSIYALYKLAHMLPDCYTILNGEEDLGISGIRMVKEKLRPSGMIRMFQGRTK